MATARALAAGTAADNFRGNEQIEDSELVVTSARVDNLRAFLPAIDDGATTTVDDGYTLRVLANSSGSIEIVDVFGRRVVTVPGFEQRVVSARGDLLNPIWQVSTPSAEMTLGTAVTAAGSSTPALGTTGPAASGTVIWYSIQKLDGTLAHIATWT